MDRRKKVVIAIGGVALSLGLAFLIFGGAGGSYGSSPSTTATGRQGAPSVAVATSKLGHVGAKLSYHRASFGTFLRRSLRSR